MFYLKACNTFIMIEFIYRYGREDEEVMGLKFCNEAVIALKQLWPKPIPDNKEEMNPLQVSTTITTF